MQLSRGKAEAQVLFEIALLMQDLGRFAADVLLFYTQEFAFVALPDAFTTGSSIMPQKRNPDVFELIRGRSATAQACLTEALGICAKLPSGYQRDLQLLKVPLFRGIDVAARTLDILPPAIDAMRFRPENINARSGHSCRGRSQRDGGARRDSLPRGVSTRRRQPQVESVGRVPRVAPGRFWTRHWSEFAVIISASPCEGVQARVRSGAAPRSLASRLHTHVAMRLGFAI